MITAMVVGYLAVGLFVAGYHDDFEPHVVLGWPLYCAWKLGRWLGGAR